MNVRAMTTTTAKRANEPKDSFEFLNLTISNSRESELLIREIKFVEK